MFLHRFLFIPAFRPRAQGGVDKPPHRCPKGAERGIVDFA